MPIDRIPSAGIESGGVAPSNLSTGAPSWDTSGNLGVGTSSPTIYGTYKTLEVRGTGGGLVQFGTGATTAAYLYQDGTNSGFTNVANGVMTFATNNVERGRFDSGGLFRIGSTSGGNGVKLQVHGDTSPDSLCSFRDTRTDSYSGAPIMYFQRTSGTVGSITTTTTTTAYNTSSDYRLKENIAPMTGALSRVAALKPCVYTWKATGETDEGFIAHELAEVCPSAVTGEKDAVNEDGSIKPQGIDTSFLVATLTAAIQELKAEVDALRAQVEAK
jgi:hypothetical protein